MSDAERALAATKPTPPLTAQADSRYILWIDQVGAYQLCLGERATLGGPAAEAQSDIPLMANLSRRHATFVRSGEGFVLEAHAPVTVCGRAVYERADLADGNEIALGASVRLRFRVPSAMSGTARLEFMSDHRPVHGVDGVILMQDVCLLGAAGENHVCCPGWTEAVVIFRRNGALWCRSRGELFIDGRHSPAGGELRSGSVITGCDFRFRIEGTQA